MKLLFDQNLSPRLATRLHDIFPDSSHVDLEGLGEATDRSVREFAAENSFVIVTKDSDFGDLLALLGFPPMVIWIRRGNCSTDEIAALLQAKYVSICEAFGDPDTGLITIY